MMRASAAGKEQTARMRRHRRWSGVLWAGFIAALTAATSPAAAQQLDVPLLLGPTDGQMAGCGGATVKGLNPRGDGFLAVRSGPSTDYAKIDELYNGDFVNTCDSRGRWYGIVYGGGDCGVHAARPRAMPYRGPCRVGWVFGGYLTNPIP